MLKAELDLHAGPGSQNGFDNSGQRGEIGWVTEDYPTQHDNVAWTVSILGQVCSVVRVTVLQCGV